MNELRDRNPNEPRPEEDPFLAGAWALDALDEAARAGYEERLRAHPGERSDADLLRETASRLGALESMPAPARLRTAVLSSIVGVPQESAQPDVVDLDARRTRRRRPSRCSVFVAAAGVAVAFAGAGVGIAEQRSASAARQDQVTGVAEVTQMLTAQGARVSTQTAASGGTATVVNVGNRVGVLINGLPATRPGRIYQLWTINGNKFTSAGLLTPDDSGGSALVFQTEMATGVGITVEPSSGSVQPTSVPILFSSI